MNQRTLEKTMPFRIHKMLFMMKETIKTRTVPGTVVQLRKNMKNALLKNALLLVFFNVHRANASGVAQGSDLLAEATLQRLDLLSFSI